MVNLEQLTGPLVGIIAASLSILAILAYYLITVRDRVLNLVDRYGRGSR